MEATIVFLTKAAVGRVIFASNASLWLFSRFLFLVEASKFQLGNKSLQIPSKRHTDKVQCYETATMKYLGYFLELKPDEVGYVIIDLWPLICENVTCESVQWCTSVILDLNLIGF